MSPRQRVLHIGAGTNLDKRYLEQPHIQYITNDISPLGGISWVYDLNIYPWQLPDAVFNIILAIDILEHLDDTKKAIEECWRLLVNNGVLELQVPFFGSFAHATDMTHKRGFTPNSFGFFIPGHPYCESQPWYSSARFKCLSYSLDLSPLEYPEVPMGWRQAMLGHQTVGNIQLILQKVDLAA